MNYSVVKMKNIVVDFLDTKPLEKQQVELVERKGIGHPDSICDGVAESVSRGLCREYIKRFGGIMHHNTDQVELIGGESNPIYRGGEIIRPMYLLLSGRATTYVGNEKVPIGRIAIESARNYLKDTIKELNLDNSIIIDQRLGQGSSDLCNVFQRKGIPKSNDTSFGVGFAPLSTVENLTLQVADYLNFKCKIKAAGKDIKVMGVRKNHEITLTIACAMISKYLDDLDDYKETIQKMKFEVEGVVAKLTDKKVNIEINTADDYEKGSVFLTVTGTSAEHGDDGSVGRGNRANGLIAPFRPTSLEATSGKNPVNHVGKIYNLLSNLIAQDIAKEGAEQVYVRLMSQIGKPINNPLVASVQIIGDKKLENKARKITDYWLEHVTDITQMCVDGKIRTF